MARYIDAEKLLNRMKQDPLFPIVERYGVSSVIEAEPTADVVERKKGKWEIEIRTLRGHKIPFFACSVCGKNADDEYNFCPNCGAKMDGGK